MKKKSPPYALIGAGLLFFVAWYFYHLIQVKQDADRAAAIKAVQDADAKALADARATTQANVVVATPNMRNVLYATQPIKSGMRISSTLYEVKLTPNEILPDAYTDKNDVVGLFAIRDIEKGDPLTPRNLGKSLPYLSQRLPVGMRAITLPVFMTGGINDTGGFVVDGDRVDLLFTAQSPDGKYEYNTQTILQNVNVLYAPGSQVKTDESDGITPVASAGGSIAVTFEVTPEEAQALVFLSSTKDGRFNMILRGRQDNSERKIKPFNAQDYDKLNLSKVQRTVDKSDDLVKQLAAQIQATEQSQGTTNETTPPTPPTP